jgi:hypothetical protein
MRVVSPTKPAATQPAVSDSLNRDSTAADKVSATLSCASAGKHASASATMRVERMARL